MKSILQGVILLLTLAIAVSPASAQIPTTPPYYTVSDFLTTTPSVEGGAMGGMFNPAAFGLARHGGIGLTWTDLDETTLMDRNWSLVADAGGLGFTMQQWKYWSGTEWQKFTDYQIGLGMGDRESRFGFAYGWSKGDLTTTRPRANLITAGYLGRPNRYLSYGAAGTWAFKEKETRGTIDLGVRPLGTPLLTVFGDATMQTKDQFEDVLWGAGVSIEPIQNLAVNFKAFDGGVYQVGLTVSAGGASVSATPHYNKSGTELYRTYGVKLGAPKEGDFVQKTIPKMMPKQFQGMQFVRLDFDAPVRYQRYRFFDDKGHTLMELLDKLETVKNDPMTGGLAIKITEDMSGSYEVLWEVREKMKEVKAAGKTIVVFLERGDMRAYYLASVANKIMVDPETSIPLMGFNFGKSYYKNALDKLGVGFDEWRFFKFKSAMESFSRTSMSDGDREQLKAIAEGFYNTYRMDVCESRGITPAQFDHVVDEVGILSADTLMAYKLADTTGRWDDMDKYLETVTGAKKKMVGMSMLTMMKPESRNWGEPPQVAVIYALGPCSMNDGINARRLEGVIKSARENKHIKAVVFRADSPGGDILPSDIVAGELKKTSEKKPVIVTQGQVAGSGGYWISMYGDKIVASPWTITGSIGVIGGWFYDNGFNSKLGLSYDNVQAGKHADIGGGAALPLIGAGLPNRNLTTEERDKMQKQILLWYDVFMTKVAKGRKMEKEKVAEIAQGHVYTGTTGKTIGLVDEMGGMETAIAMAKKAAKIKPDTEVNIREMPSKGDFDLSMFQPKLLGIRLDSFGFLNGAENSEAVYLKMLLNADGRPVAMVSPEFMLDDR